MKQMRFFTLALCGLAGFSAGTLNAPAEFEVSAGVAIHSSSDFYQPLAARGQWIQVGTFGRCWHPTVAVAWRPYCDGYWEWTDCGWYWVSDEPWAWACYHYGTWAFDQTDGWVWIPGVEWAPAWVNWRTGGDYVGWAPCGPSGVTIDSSAYVFVQSQHFNDHIRPNNVVVNNTAIISHTTEIKSVGREQREIGGRSQTVVVNHGPEVATMEKATGHRFTPVSVQKADQSTLRSAPDQVKRGTAEPQTRELRTTPDRIVPDNGTLDNRNSPTPGPGVSPQSPNERAIRPGIDELPRKAPNGGITSQSPNERTIRPSPNELPHSAPNDGTVPQSPNERTVRQIPPDETLPKVKNVIPAEKVQQHPKEIVTPNQVPRQPTPVAPPGGQVPVQKRLDQDHNPNP